MKIPFYATLSFILFPFIVYPLLALRMNSDRVSLSLMLNIVHCYCLKIFDKECSFEWFSIWIMEYGGLLFYHQPYNAKYLGIHAGQIKNDLW